MNSLDELRQSTAEVLAFAVSELFPGVLLVEGTANEFGFFYDFIAQQPIDEHALPLIEEKMRSIIKGDAELRSLDMMRENAASFFEHKNQPLIADRVSRANENIVSVMQIGAFADYCPFSHITDMLSLTAFKLLRIEKEMRYLPEAGEEAVIRIHGTVFRELPNLKKYLKGQNAAKKRDHRVLGKQMDLFKFIPDVSVLEWFWRPKGAVLREILLNFWRQEFRQQGFALVATPRLLNEDFAVKSGDFNGEHECSAVVVNGTHYVFNQGLASAHAALFGSELHSYRNLPVRYAECAQVMPLKNGGRLWGLHASEIIETDAAHLFCSPEQLETELISSLQFIDKIIKILGFERHWYLRQRGPKFAGTVSYWEKGHSSFTAAFEKSDLKFDAGETAFSGPAAEVYLVDAVGREWKGPSIAIDFSIPERLGLRYQAANDKMHVPIMIKMSLYGSLERFIALLVEHYAGQLPLWLTPEQVRVIPLGEGNSSYAESIGKAIEKAGFRVSVDYRRDQLGSKVHGAEIEKIPYIVVVGENEEKQRSITVRSSYRETVLKGVALEDFLKQLQEEVLSNDTGNAK